MILHENYTLANGVQIPRLGLGTWMIPDEQADEAEQKLSEAVEQMNDTLTDASMKLNGVEDGIHSYDRVVQLMIAYYRDKDGDS